MLKKKKLNILDDLQNRPRLRLVTPEDTPHSLRTEQAFYRLAKSIKAMTEYVEKQRVRLEEITLCSNISKTIH